MKFVLIYDIQANFSYNFRTMVSAIFTRDFLEENLILKI